MQVIFVEWNIPENIEQHALSDPRRQWSAIGSLVVTDVDDSDGGHSVVVKELILAGTHLQIVWSVVFWVIDLNQSNKLYLNVENLKNQVKF